MSSLYFPTRADIRARVRFFIDEPVQANYTDSDLNYAINDAQQDAATEITQVNEHYFVNPTATVITPTTTNGVLNSQYTLASDFFKMTRMEIQSTGEMVPFIDMNEKTIGNQAIPPLVNTAGYGAGLQAFIIGSDVQFTPPLTDPTMLFQYWYEPILPDLTQDTDVSQFPRQFIDILAIMAAIDALIKDEDDTSQLERKLARKINQMSRTARNRQVQNPKYVRRTDMSSALFPWVV
jgi:hypothetical protein